MRYFLALSCAAFLLLYPAYAHALVEAQKLEVSREGDLALSCGALSREALTMRDIIFTTQDIKDTSELQSTGIGMAGTVGSFLVGTATGGIGIAAAGYVAHYMADEKADSAENIQDTAQQRRSFMMGIFNAKGCHGPIEHVLDDPLPSNPLWDLVSIEPSGGDDENAETTKLHHAASPRYNE